MIKVKHDVVGNGDGTGLGCGKGNGCGHTQGFYSEYFLLSKSEYGFNNANAERWPLHSFKFPYLYRRIITELKLYNAHL